MKTRHSILFFFILLTLLLSACDQIAQVAGVEGTPTAQLPLVTDNGLVVVEGNIAPRDSIHIATRSGGKVAEVLVQEGDVVEEGALLVRLGEREQAEAALTAARLEQQNAQKALDDLNNRAGLTSAQAQAELTAANLALIEAQQELDDFDDDTYKTDLDNARTDVTEAKDDLDDAQEEWDKYEDLDEDNSTRKNAKTRLEDMQKKYNDMLRERDRLINQMDEYKAAVAAAEARLADAQREWDKRKNGAPAPDELALAQSRLDNAQAQVIAAEAALTNLEIQAPFAGTIVDLDVTVGGTLLPNQQIILLADLSELYVETNDLTEMEVVKISEGQAAQVTPDALPELALDAVVEDIDRTSGKKGGDVIYTARLKLADSDPRLRWGMTVEVRFED